MPHLQIQTDSQEDRDQGNKKKRKNAENRRKLQRAIMNKRKHENMKQKQDIVKNDCEN